MKLKKLKKLLALLFFSPFALFGEPQEFYFSYDLHISSLPGKNDRTILCFHGYGDNYQIAEFLKEKNNIKSSLLSFNFPEYDIKNGREYDPRKAAFGTIEELLPALYVMKKLVIEQGLDSIDLYGFSAGGGVLINVIAVLNTKMFDVELKKIGVGPLEKDLLLSAIQKGIILLDTPLKSIEEIIDFRGSNEELEILAQNYRTNHLRPIDSLKHLKNLSLDVLLHFQENDEVLSNRDDFLYVQTLKENQPKGKVFVIIENEGGHMAHHSLIWKIYEKKISS